MISPAIHAAMMFRLLFGTQDDRYEPEHARYVIDAVQSLDHGSATVTITLAIDAARWERGRAKRGIQPFL